MIDTSEFIQNPSKLSNKFIKIIKKLNQRIENSLTKKSVVNKIKKIVNFEMYMYHGYKKYYSYLINYDLKQKLKKHTTVKGKFKMLFAKFEKLYEQIMFNNIVLAYTYSKDKSKKNIILTKDEEKIIYFKKLYEGDILVDEFNEYFGHFSLNPYELSQKRFREYSKDELMNLASFTKNYVVSCNKKLKYYIDGNNKHIFSILVGLRELGKYKSLLIVDEIRKISKQIETDYKIKNIFQMSYDQIIQMLDKK
ncbi:hypothetical protein HOD20_07275 [archaeon]|nr:hypothetical protein [archaeon]